MDFFQPTADNYPLLTADADNRYNFTFLYFKDKLITCRLCTPEGKKDKIAGKDRWFIMFIYCVQLTGFFSPLWTLAEHILQFRTVW